MNIEFVSGFKKDLSQLRDKRFAEVILECIILFEKAKSLDDIPNIKKLTGHPTAYRFKKSKYRIGVYLENGTVTFAAFAPRDKIYKKFP
jgi:mRNA interferase RelE/StbE